MTEHPIVVTAAVVRNLREGHGWLPLLIVDGKIHGNVWQAYGYSQDVAERLANLGADKEAGRYSQDFETVVNYA